MTSTPISATTLLQQLSWRYATKKFDAERKIPAETWAALEEALVLSPSSFGLQPWRFIVVKTPETRKALQEASWNQTQVVDASHLVVLASKNDVSEEYVGDFLSLVAETRSMDLALLDTYRGMILQFVSHLSKAGKIPDWTTKQSYIALGFLLSSAALLGVDACPLEGINPQKYDELLNLSSQGYSTRVACALGYRATDDKAANLQKVRFAKDRCITYA
jgi:nitroreductase